MMKVKSLERPEVVKLGKILQHVSDMIDGDLKLLLTCLKL